MRHVDFQQMQAELKSLLRFGSDVSGTTAQGAESATVGTQHSPLQEIIQEHITVVERTYGVGLHACFELCGHLQREMTEQRGWFLKGSQDQRGVIEGFLAQYDYINAAYFLVKLIKESKLRLFNELQGVEAQRNLDLLEQQQFLTVKDFFFKLMSIIHPILERINDDDFLNFFNRLFLPEYLCFYTACDVEGDGATTFTEIAHALFCNAIMDPSGVFGQLTLEKRKLISVLLHYLKNCPSDSGNIPHVRRLFFTILYNPECVLTSALPTEDTLLPFQGVLVQAGNMTRDFIEGHYHSFFGSLASTVASSLPRSNFMNALNSFRNIQQETRPVVDGSVLFYDFHKACEFLCTTMADLRFTTYKFQSEAEFMECAGVAHAQGPIALRRG